MWHYNILINKKAQKELEKLPTLIIKKIVKRIEQLMDNPYPYWHKKLKNFNIWWFEGLSLYRIREGNYRIIYCVENNHLIIQIIRIAHRKEVYSNF